MLTGCAAPAAPEPRARVAVADALGGPAQAGFARATEPRPFVFPADHGPHPEFAAEWWYYTGSLAAEDGRMFGFQLTFFRIGVAPGEPLRPSAWAATSIYMAHFALTDVAGGRFYAFERLSRGAAGLAGAQGEPFRVWLEGWSAEGLGADGTPMRLRAEQDGVAIDLTLEAGRPPVLQGDRGLSRKGAEPGNASLYYSLTRMPASGSLRTPETAAEVRGLAWMDREWSTSALAPGLVGWDWFALQLDDGRDLMYYQLRRADGSADPFSKGALVSADGAARTLGPGDVLLEPAETWRSPRSGGSYPTTWRLRVPSEGLDLRVGALLQDQELPLSVTYWEGAVAVSGGATGRGYLEMTGYADGDLLAR